MNTYQHLSLEERVEVQCRLEVGDSLRTIACLLGRSPSTLSRECRRAAVSNAPYKAHPSSAVGGRVLGTAPR